MIGCLPYKQESPAFKHMSIKSIVIKKHKLHTQYHVMFILTGC